MTALETRPLGRGGPAVTVMGLGGTGLGNMYRAATEAEAVATVRAAFDAGIRYFDTAPVYGYGLSETRLGLALRELPRDEVVISSKVGYGLDPVAPNEVEPTLWAAPGAFRPRFDYSADGVKRSVEESLKRLAVERIDMLAIHDPDEALHFAPGEDPFARSRFREAMDGAYPVLDEMRSQGLVKAIGVGINQWQMLVDFVEAGRFDYFLLAGRYTLLEQEPLDTLLPLCEARGTKLVIGGPYNSGILATGADAGDATFNTRPAPDAVRARVRRLEAVCGRHGVSLAAAALQFPLAHPSSVSVIPGGRSPAEVETNRRRLAEPIPAAFWQALRDEGLVRADAPVPA